MARRVIGLDVGTHAVRLAEIELSTTPTLHSFGQVAMPAGAMDEGEVEDDQAVADAVARLRSEMGLRKVGVRLGLASPRVVVRHVELPMMSEADLHQALELQAQDLVPIPVEEAVIDYAVVGSTEPVEGEEPRARVLLAAAHRSAVQRLVDAVEAGGLSVESVDLVPLALIRALGGTGIGAEAVVSFGSGVTVVSVHSGGVPEFVRMLGTGGDTLTRAIATELGVTDEEAEKLKRKLAVPTHLLNGDTDAVARARRAIDRPLGVLLDEVRSSIDYHRNQAGTAPLDRVLITGGASQLPGLADRLAGLVGITVEVAHPRSYLKVGNLGFDEQQLPHLDPYLLAADGLALGSNFGGVSVDLLASRSKRTVTGRQRTLLIGAGAMAGLMVLLAVPTLAVSSDISSEKHATATAVATNARLQTQIDSLAGAAEKQASLDASKAQIKALLATDVSWSRMLQDVARSVPNDVWLTSFDATATPASGTGAVPAVAGDGAPAPAVSGTVTFAATGLGYPSVAQWIQRMGDIPSLADVWVQSITKTVLIDGQETATFGSTASLTQKAISDRVDQIVEGNK